MEFKDFFKDFEKGILKDEFRTERKEEFREFIRQMPRRGKGRFFRPGEYAAFYKERKERLDRLRARKQQNSGGGTASPA